MRNFLNLYKSVSICTILLFALIFAAFAGITVSAGEIISDQGGATWREVDIFDANDYDTCRAYVNFYKSTGYDYLFIPWVYGIASHSMRSESTNTDGNVSKGSYSGWVDVGWDFKSLNSEYTGKISRGTVAVDKKYFTSNYDDLDMEGSAYIHNNYDGSAESRATWP